MASDWIKMRVDLQDDEAVIIIADTLKLETYAVIGRLHKLWAWADKHSVDGNAMRVTRFWIDRYVEQKGFANAMEKAKWLKGKDEAITFPNFERHNGNSAKKRAETNLRVARHRATRQQHNSNGGGVTKRVTKSVTREEKRREDIYNPPNPLIAPGFAFDSSFVLPWGTPLPEGITSGTIKAIDEGECDAEVIDQAGRPWVCAGPRWRQLKEKAAN